MAEDFRREDVRSLLRNKFVIIIGDSVMRGLFKDLVFFLQNEDYITRAALRRKGEETCHGDELIEGGVIGEMTNKTHYREIRQYRTDFFMLRFYFVTQVYNPYFETIVEDLLHESSPKPDLILMNSCLWDMSRYGPRWLSLYRENLDKMLTSVKPVTEGTLFIWLTCMPIGKRARGGFLPRGIDWRQNTLRLDVLEANFFARQAVQFHGFDILDLNYHFREFTHLRTEDDVHWLPEAHRRMTCLILNHVCTAWSVPRPRRIKPLPLLNMNFDNMRSRHRRNITMPSSVGRVVQFRNSHDQRNVIRHPRDRFDYDNFSVESRNYFNGQRDFSFGQRRCYMDVPDARVRCAPWCPPNPARHVMIMRPESRRSRNRNAPY